MTIKQAISRVRSLLTDDLRKPQYRGHPNLIVGQCYVCCEALFHLFPKRFVPQTVRHEGSVHWFLRDKRTSRIIDPTWDQFQGVPDYKNARGCGFLTKDPSKRTNVILNRIRDI